MRGLRDRQRVIVFAAGTCVVCLLIAALGWSDGATAAPDVSALCVTATPLPTATGTMGGTPSPSPPLPTATTPRMNGALLSGGGPTATTPASPTPLPVCTPVPAAAKSAVGTTTGASSVAAVSASGANNAPAGSAVGAGKTVAASSVTSSSSSVQAPVGSSSGPPPAAVGPPPPPPPGYQAPVGVTPNQPSQSNVAAANAFSQGGAPVVSVVRGQQVPGVPPSGPLPPGASGGERSVLSQQSITGEPAVLRIPIILPQLSTQSVAAGPPGMQVPIIIPRAGHPARDPVQSLGALLGAACIALGMAARCVAAMRRSTR